MRKAVFILAAAGFMLSLSEVSAAEFSKAPDRGDLPSIRRGHKAKRGAGADITPIITSPKGEAINYNKNCTGTFVLGNNLSLYQDEFPATIIWGSDNDVYFKNLVSVFPDDYYLKGTVSGNMITVECNQTIEYIEEEGYGINFGVFRTVPRIQNGNEVVDFEYASDIKSISFKVSADGSLKMILPGAPFDGETVPEYTAGFYYTDDYQFTGYSDFAQEYTRLSLEMVQIPDGADIKQYAYIDSYNFASIVDVAFCGDDLYVRGLNSMLPEATIRGKIQGDKAVVAQDEYLGIYYDQYYVFTKVLYANPDYNEDNPQGVDPFVFAPSDVGFELNIDKEKGIIYADKEGTYLSFHGDANDYSNTLGYYDVFTLKYQETFAGTPANPVDLEYTTEWAYIQGFNDFFFTLSNFSTDGNILDVTKLYYKVFVNGVPEVFNEREQKNLLGEETTVYPGVPVEVNLLPYEFSNDLDIFKYASNIFDIGIYRDDVATIGLQTVYYFEDKFTYSDIVTLDVATGEITTESGVDEIWAEPDIESTSYYSLSGLKVGKPAKGIYIRVDTMTDGTLRMKKEAL